MEIETIKIAVARQAADFAAWLFPAGRRMGSRWHVGDLLGNPGESLAIDLDGEFAGSFRDWATDERGDCIALAMAVRGIQFADATRILRERYGVSSAAPIPPKSRRVKPAKLILPAVDCGSRKDLRCLAGGRNLAPDALEIASSRGLLWFYNSSEGRAWLITDKAHRNAQARRLDGQPWAWNGKKAWTLGGSCASLPIGLPESATLPSIALCAGGPDFLAAFHHAHASGLSERVAPVCMIGETLDIAGECLSGFTGKRVRIFVHADATGLAAAQRWATQIRGHASRVDGFTFDGLFRTDGKPVKDLCDLASIGADSWDAYRDTVENCMAFASEGGAE
jgi:hypothetical protein